MERAELLAALIDLAGEVGVPVRRISASQQDELAPAGSGACLVHGRPLVLLSAADPPERQLEVLARALRQYAGEALEMRFLPPAIRACLDRGA